MPTALAGLDDGLLDDASSTALAALAADPGPVPLLVLEVPAGDVGPRAAEAFARACLRDERAKLADVRVCAPASDRWSVAEVDERIVAPSNLQPIERNVIVVAAADAMDPRTAEHLLKTIEEPAAPSLFVFLAASASALLATILGRAGHVLRLRLAPAAERKQALIEKGADPDTAHEAVALAGAMTALAARAAEPGEQGAAALEALRALSAAPLWGSAPATRAAAFVAGCEALAPSGSARKAAVRDLCRLAISRWRAELGAQARRIEDVAGYAAGEQAASALAEAEADLRAYTSPLVVLTALFAACSRPPSGTTPPADA